MPVRLQHPNTMDVRTVIFCAFLCVCFEGVFGQVGSMCRPNERLLSCGCPKTCRDPVPDCEGVCKEGCFCEEGEVRNDKGICVKLAECPPLPTPYKLETSEPRLHEGTCPENEEYRFCEPCNRSCDNPNPICPAQCAKGCFCKGNLLRDKDGRCVKFEKCSNFLEYIREREKNVFAPIPHRFSCGKNQQYSECQKCTQTCNDPEPVCGKCRTGCVCKEGYMKGPDGKCVTREECPKEAAILVTHFFASIEDCSSSEEYLSCGWCEPTCQVPAPVCPAGCTKGCLCRPPTVRHANGLCIYKEQCPPKCSDTNEEYTCLFGCEHQCSTVASDTTSKTASSAVAVDTSCQVRRYPLRCVLGCHCKRGLFRDGSKCVKREECARHRILL